MLNPLQFAFMRGFLGSDSHAPLSAQIGGVVGLSLIAGFSVPVGIRGILRRRWSGVALLLAFLCLGVLGMWLASA